MNSMQVLQKTEILKDGRAMMDILLYRMIGLQVVHPALTVDIEKLKVDFVHGYRSGAAILYASTTNFLGSEREVQMEERGFWDRNWHKQDREFEAFLKADLDLKFLSNKYFYIWSGNHCHQASLQNPMQMTLNGPIELARL